MANAIRLDDVFSGRSRTYSVRGGQLVVRLVSAIDEARKRDFLKNVVTRLAKGAKTKAKKAVIGALDRADAKRPIDRPPPPSEKRPESPKPVERAKETETQSAEREASQAKARAAQAVKIAASKRSETKSAGVKRQQTIDKSRKAQMRAALAANKKARQEKKAARKQKEIANTAPASATGPGDRANQVNAQVAHCMLALHYKRGKDVRGSWNICRASLTKHGYLKGPYRETGGLDTVKATQKGTRRAMQHAMEKHPLNGGIKGSPAEKFNKFRNLFRQIEPTV